MTLGFMTQHIYTKDSVAHHIGAKDTNTQHNDNRINYHNDAKDIDTQDNETQYNDTEINDTA
jgi:hypothetical protein